MQSLLTMGIPVDGGECDGTKVKWIPSIIVQLYSIAWVLFADCQQLPCRIRHLHASNKAVRQIVVIESIKLQVVNCNFRLLLVFGVRIDAFGKILIVKRQYQSSDY